jgi:hypothetical protein
MDSRAAPLLEDTRAKDDAAPRTRSTWKQKFLALFVTWHLVAVIIYVLPYPMFFDPVNMARPETQEEMHRLFGTLLPLTPWWKTEGELQNHALGIVKGYMDGYFKARKVFEPYLQITGSEQSWNMFAGTPPRYPLVFMVEVWPKSGKGWVPFQDMHWGTADFHAVHFRHFELQGNLSAPGWDRHRQWYAEYWARRWNQVHPPEQRAQYVHFYYFRLTTPKAASVRAGDNDRHPEHVQDFYWSIPPSVNK